MGHLSRKNHKNKKFCIHLKEKFRHQYTMNLFLKSAQKSKKKFLLFSWDDFKQYKQEKKFSCL